MQAAAICRRRGALARKLPAGGVRPRFLQRGRLLLLRMRVLLNLCLAVRPGAAVAGLRGQGGFGRRNSETGEKRPQFCFAFAAGAQAAGGRHAQGNRLFGERDSFAEREA